MTSAAENPCPNDRGSVVNRGACAFEEDEGERKVSFVGEEEECRGEDDDEIPGDGGMDAATDRVG